MRNMKKFNKPTVVVASLEFHRHPRAQKILKTLAEGGFNVEAWAARDVKIRFRLLRALIRYFTAMCSLVLKNADIFWIENVPDIVYLPLLLKKSKYVYDRRSPWALEIKSEFKNEIFKKIAEVIERALMKRASALVAVSKGLACEVSPYDKLVEVIPNYPESSMSNLIVRDLRTEFNISPSTKILIYLGKLSYIEGADLLPKIAKVLEKEDAELWILGDGPLADIIRKTSEKYVNTRWFGWVPHREVPNYIMASDIGIVPRHKNRYKIMYSYEGIHKISEYFLFGKPVIASEIAPSRYYLVVKEEELPNAVVRAVRNDLILPKPPRLTWERYCRSKVLDVVEKVLADG